MKAIRIAAVFVLLVISAIGVMSLIRWERNYLRQVRYHYAGPVTSGAPEGNQENETGSQKKTEIYLFATGYYHPEEDQGFYASGSYEEDLELNGEGITASGKKVRRGYVAVDPSVIPLGTELYAEEYGILKAEDTGGRIKGNRIDIFTGDGEDGLIEALKIRRWLKLKILKWGNQTPSGVALIGTSN